jgi:hypothetical protein
MFELIFGPAFGLFFWWIVRPTDHPAGNCLAYDLLFVALGLFFLGVFSASVNDTTHSEVFALKSTGHVSSFLSPALGCFISACTVGLLNLALFLRRDKDDD